MTISRRLMTATIAALLAVPVAATAQPGGAAKPTAERPIFLLDQIRSGPVPGKLMPALQPLKKLEQIEALLKANGVAYRRGVGMMDSRRAPANLVQVVTSLPPGEVFVLPENGGASFNQILRLISPAEAASIAKAATPAPARAPKT
ncbi:hypothetical protein [Phenylobacterium sp.]|uniref:hypothetical protein n=1 Tax=Phenylobacterium sp. TaxID=1871053 RepID=UPI0025D95884|nr:hypothetical protein [Phenylobacterium sp.]MBX3485140.1 hypothetical protein [Phenylobacterium sp.]